MDYTLPINKPDFIHWSFGGKNYASTPSARSVEFSLWMDPKIEKRPYFFREEVMRAAQKIDRDRQGKPVALCYTGGVDSEVIALALSILGIPFELYFLDLWGLNLAAFQQWSSRLESRLGKKTRVIRLERKYFYEQYFLNAFAELGCGFPTYLTLPYLFDHIPMEEYIVTGDGDLYRSGGNLLPPQEAGLWIPFQACTVTFWIWSSRKSRRGEFCFYSSTPELLASVLTSPHYRHNFPYSDPREVVYSAFPEIERRPKTTNWDGTAYRENKWLRAWIGRHAQRSENHSYWRKHPGVPVNMNKLFVD